MPDPNKERLPTGRFLKGLDDKKLGPRLVTGAVITSPVKKRESLRKHQSRHFSDRFAACRYPCPLTEDKLSLFQYLFTL